MRLGQTVDMQILRWRPWKKLAPFFVAAAIALSLHACQSAEAVRALPPEYTIPYDSDPTEITNCAIERYLQIGATRIPKVVSTEGQITIANLWGENLIWEAILKDGEAQIRVSNSSVGVAAELFATAFEECAKKLTSNSQ